MTLCICVVTRCCPTHFFRVYTVDGKVAHYSKKQDINERFEDIAHKISDKIETAETLINQNFDAYTLLNSEERTTVNTIILEALSRNNYNLDSIDYEIKTTVVD